jgi:hypothetical protein
MAEANRLFTSKAAWRKVEVMDPNIVVETIPLSGEYAQSGRFLCACEYRHSNHDTEILHYNPYPLTPASPC